MQVNESFYGVFTTRDEHDEVVLLDYGGIEMVDKFETMQAQGKNIMKLVHFIVIDSK